MSVGYPARRSIGHDTEPSMTVVATPLPDTVPSRNPASVTVRPGSRAGARAAQRRARPVQEERAGAGMLEHGAEDREQDDVGGRHIQRHAEHALERHVERADEPVEPVAAVRERAEADQVEEGAPSA